MEASSFSFSKSDVPCREIWVLIFTPCYSFIKGWTGGVSMHKTAAATRPQYWFRFIAHITRVVNCNHTLFLCCSSLAGLIVKPTHHFLWADECLHACGADLICTPSSPRVYFITRKSWYSHQRKSLAPLFYIIFQCAPSHEIFKLLKTLSRTARRRRHHHHARHEYNTALFFIVNLGEQLFLWTPHATLMSTLATARQGSSIGKRFGDN